MYYYAQKMKKGRKMIYTIRVIKITNFSELILVNILYFMVLGKIDCLVVDVLIEPP